MFGNLLKNFLRQVVIIRANNIPKKFLNFPEKSTMLFLNYQKKFEHKSIKITNQGTDGQEKNKDQKIQGIDKVDKK